MKLILPVAGDSSRFPNVRPKWLLTHPNGHLMFHEALSGLDLSAVDELLIVCREDHYATFRLDDVIRMQFEVSSITTPHRVIVIPPTRSQPETVARALEYGEVRGPFFVKDSDNRFTMAVTPGNTVATLTLAEVGLTEAANKSYVELSEHGHVVNIVEKHVISDTFCVGGYGFESTEGYLDVYRALADAPGLYVSHVIYRMLLDGVVFRHDPVTAFSDWGTLRDWERYKEQFATLFVDIDGTLVTSSAQFFEPRWGETPGLPGNIEALQRLYHSGTVRIILTTSRTRRWADKTEQQLRALGVPYHDILYDLLHAPRLVINDFSRSNRYPTAVAVNMARDTDTLAEMLRATFPCLR